MKEQTTMMTIRPKHAQQGFTIIEIMVAVTLSLILLYGVIEVFLGSQASYRLQTGMARVQENARFALDTMARSIGMAGADETGVDSAINPFVTINTRDDITPDAVLGFTVLNEKASDTISVNYQSTTDCLGNATPVINGIPLATDYFYLARDPVTNVSNLYCNGQPLVEGIENMQILYGEDLDTGGTNSPNGSADRYVSANNVTDWGEIASVRIAILASTVDNAGVTTPATYYLLNTPPIGPINDKLGRRVYTRTIMVRNH